MTHPSAELPSTRFAPSPTGPLHMGSLVTALASYLYIKSMGGLWHVRIDDIDPPRQDPNAIDQILNSLNAHGLHSDGSVDFQSTHAQAYADALDALKDCIFYCRCSRRSLADLPIYPGTCRDQKTPQEDSSIRLAVGDSHINYTDEVMGDVSVDLATSVGDFIIRRRDGLIAYHLATAVDDAQYSHILRGQDLAPTTPMQILLMQKLGLTVPTYAHIPVLCFADGTKLSKQAHAPPLDDTLALTNVQQALGYLGLQAPSDLTVASTLEWALDTCFSNQWDLSALPRKLSVYTPDK